MSESTASVEPVLSARGLCRSYGAFRAVDDVSLEVGSGERLGLVGESGSGKSTVLRLLLRLEDADAGRVHFDGDDVSAKKGRDLLPFRRAVQVVFQDPSSALNPRMRVGDLVAEGLIIHGLHAERREARVRELLAEVGLDDERLIQRRPTELSGGQKQRVGLARALAVEPRVLLLDEPVSALDVSVQAQVINLLAALSAKRGLAMIFVAHDLHVVAHLCERIAVMHNGRIVESGPTTALMEAPQQAYTQALLAAIPTRRARP
jgi:ABC-type glutathione transport system ATPase component